MMDRDLLLSIWERLKQAAPRRRKLNGANKIAADIVQSGWCLRFELEDLLETFDGRLYDLDVWLLADYLDAPRRTVYKKPRFLTAANIGNEVISATDAAGMLIFLEQIGFEVDPTILVNSVLPDLASRRYLTGSELDVVRYPTQNGRHYVQIRCRSRGPGRLQECSIRTSGGIRIRAILSDDQPYELHIKGPRYRSRPRPRMYHCDYCGMDYMRGDPEESLEHRSNHARLRRILDPWPKRQFLEDLNTLPDAELVRARSPMWRHHEMYARAQQFRREMHFDFVQWGHRTPRDTDPDVHGFLFSDTTGTLPNGTIVGACCFRRRDDRWSLSWVWIAPKMRRKGILARRWNGLIERFGDFAIEPPVSDAMRSFIFHHGTSSQRDALVPLGEGGKEGASGKQSPR